MKNLNYKGYNEEVLVMFEVYQCNNESSLKRLFSKDNKKPEKMFIQIDDNSGEVKVSGRAYIANAEGKNEYVNSFDELAKNIISVKKGEFAGADALVLNMRIKTVYESKKIQIILPRLANLNQALGVISNYVREV